MIPHFLNVSYCFLLIDNEMIPHFLNVSYCFILIDNEMISHFYTLVIASYSLIIVTYSNTRHKRATIIKQEGKGT